MYAENQTRCKEDWFPSSGSTFYNYVEADDSVFQSDFAPQGVTPLQPRCETSPVSQRGFFSR